MKLFAIAMLAFGTTALAQTFAFGLFPSDACTTGTELSGTECFYADCDFSSTTTLTGGSLPYGFKIDQFETDCGLYLYTGTGYTGSYGYIPGSEMSQYECIYFVNGSPIKSIQIDC